MRIRFRQLADSTKAGALSVEEALHRVRVETGLDLDGARARLGFSRGHLLELTLLSSAFGSKDDDRALDAANLLVPCLIGESAFDDWVGAVEVGPAPRAGSLRVLPAGATPPAPTLSLDDIAPAFEAAIRSVVAALPESPYHALSRRDEWTLLEADPAPASDYAAQDDLVLCSTCLPEALKCFLQGSRFSSRRFSRHGERFVYAKVDGAERSMEARYALRVSLEEALDAALAPSGLGCVVGAGIGIRYVYVVLALTHPELALLAARDALRAADVPPRAWLLPCDSDNDGEWAGVWDDAPEPPSSE